MTNKNYSNTSVILHGLSALIMIGLFILGFWMVGLDYYAAWYVLAPIWHINFGLLLLLMTLWRLWWRYTTQQPQSVNQGVWLLFEKIGHHTLYLLLVLVLVSGYLIFSDGQAIGFFDLIYLPTLTNFINNQSSTFGNIHWISAYIIMTITVLHAFMAFWHHFVKKDNILKRMFILSTKGEDND